MKALIIQGGWAGHEPETVAEFYQYEGQAVTMPVIWTKQWGKGRVFYSALGHVAEEFINYSDVTKMTINGLKWAARSLK